MVLSYSYHSNPNTLFDVTLKSKVADLRSQMAFQLVQLQHLTRQYQQYQ